MKIEISILILKASLAVACDNEACLGICSVRIEATESKTTYIATDGRSMCITTEQIGQLAPVQVSLPLSLVEQVVKMGKLFPSGRVSLEIHGEQGMQTILTVGGDCREPGQYPQWRQATPTDPVLSPEALSFCPTLAESAAAYWKAIAPKASVTLVPIKARGMGFFAALPAFLQAPQKKAFEDSGLTCLWFGMPISQPKDVLMEAKASGVFAQ